MSLYGSAVRKPITTMMIFLAIIVFGLFSLSRMPIDMYPDIEFPAISVFTTYPGANATDIETNITKPIEDALNTVDQLKQISSSSRDNMSVVILEFEYGSDLSEAANNIRDALSFVQDNLPEDAANPMIFKFSSSMMPIAMYAITADDSYAALEKILDEKLVGPLNRIDGIGSVSFVGAPTREISIDINPSKIEAYNLTVEQIGNILKAENLNMPTGNLEMGEMNYPLRVEGEFKSSDFIKDIVLGSYLGQTIFLKDVATIRDSIKKVNIEEKINGKFGVRMMVMKQSGANTVEIAEKVNKKIDEMKEFLPEDIEISTIFDSSDYITGSIGNLTKTLMFALFFVSLVVMMFLGRWRATFIIILTIPISLIVAFTFLDLTGNSINIISLSALSIAIGMVVDDAIVVLENISRHIDRGSSPREAAIYATNEVWLAVIVTTLTIVAVFLPMTMIGGMTGVMFRQLGWIVSITVVTSTIAAISLTPMLSSKLLKLKKKTKEPKKYSYEKLIMPLFDRLDNWYAKTIEWCLSRKWLVLGVSIGIFLFSFALIPQLGGEFMPESDDGRININIELQSGIQVDKTIEVANKIEEIIDQYPEVELIASSAGSNEGNGFIAMFQASGYNIINLMISLKNIEERDRTKWDIAEDIRKQLDEFPEIVSYSFDQTMTGMGSSTIDVEIYGFDIQKTNLLAKQISDTIETLKGARDVKISRDKSKPELRVELDRDKMATVGLNTAIVSTALYNRVTGLTATTYREEGEEYNVVIRFEENYRNTISDIENISIQTLSGQKVKVKEIGEIKEYWSPPNIDRKRRERIVTISTTPYQISMGELASAIDKKLETMDIPREFVVEVGGAYEDQQEGFQDIGLLGLLILLLVYIVMASQFESLKMPFIIMTSILFSFTGVILTLFITGTTLSIIAALGSVMLIGIVVKNGIVLVDYINLMRDRGYPLDQAIIESGRSRLRPVLMTALTTILGMLPLALSSGEGAEIWSPMGISIIGGLMFSTLITMVFVPVIYRLFTASGERNKKKRFRERFDFMDN